MIRKTIFGLLLTLLFCFSGSAQQYNFKRFSVEEGLPRSGVYCMLEDSRGFLWVGTEGGGLAQFNGTEFRVYTTSDGLADNTVRCMIEDGNGHLWLGTNGSGLCRFDGHRFTTYTKEDGLSSNYVRSIVEDSIGQIWVGTFGGGISRLSFSDSLSVKVFDKSSGLPHNKVRAAIRDSNGKLWFGTDNGLCSWNGEKWITLTQSDGLTNNRILVLYEDALQNLWVGTQEGVNLKEDSTFVRYSAADGLIHDRIRGITQDHLGNMWFGTQNGVTRFDGLNFQSFTESNGLSNDRIRYILTDRTGNIWFGTFFGGICRYSGEEFLHFTENDGISSNQVLSVFNNYDGDIWLGTLEGITELIPNRDGTWTVKSNPLEIDFSGYTVNYVHGAEDSTIWIGTNEGVFLKKGTRVEQLKVDGAILNENVKFIHFEPEGALWIGSQEGATRLIPSKAGFKFDQYHSMPNANESEVSSIYQDATGRVWIAYLNSSVTVFDNQQFIQPDVPEKLINVSSITKGPNEKLWFATEGSGLFTFDVKSEISRANFKHISTEDGLSSSDIHQLAFDGQNDLWIGTAAGIDRIELTGQGDVKSIQHYGMAEGFIGTETNENAACLDYSGNVWFGTIRGATRYNPMAEPQLKIEPNLHITGVGLEFQDVDWNASELADSAVGYFHLPRNLELPYDLNGIRISYQAIDLRAPHQVKYQWKLEGYNDNEWSLIENDNSMTFTNLSPNRYTFKVRAVGSSGVWSSQPVEFQFRVLAPFWMKWWFITLCAMVLVGIVFGIIKIREKRLEADKKKLQQKVDERTKELRAEKERSDELLLNILPLETAEELKEKGYASVQRYERVSVLFTDFVGFTNITEGITHEELVSSLDEHFRMFDEVMDKYGIEKIKTIGDAYMAAGGIPTRTVTNPLAVVAAGLEMIACLQALNKKKELKGQKAWQLRLGIHTGSVISGVVGKNKFAFDIWGDAVNTAARMESSGEVMKVNVSGSTYELIKDYFECTPRGKIKAKNKGEIEMYFVERLKPKYSDDQTGMTSNATFMALLAVVSEETSLTN
jgi:ligand-binding sensor domain-containing protein/class 3 adenylate cyclase